jgi:tryptophan synthase alpha chain
LEQTLTMNRITHRLTQRDKRKLLIPFFTVGYPDYQTSLELVKVASDSGADFIELGMPFSDPLADGPEIQLSSAAALRNGINLKKILNAVETIRTHSEVPLILMGYYNPILTYGDDRFLSDAARVGVDGLIVPDLPVEEAGRVKRAADALGLSTIFLVAPTSTTNRIKRIEQMSSDFVYAVTVTGVTGARQGFSSATDAYLAKLRRLLCKPFVAGFGVSSPETARRLVRFSNGVVIGSALVRIIASARSKRHCLTEVGKFLASIRNAI